MDALLSRKTQRISNFIFKNLVDYDAPYSFTLGRYDMSLQCSFDSNMVGYLKRKNFKVKVDNYGHLELSKIIADYKIRIVFTD